jgi:hypothetical protein
MRVNRRERPASSALAAFGEGLGEVVASLIGLITPNTATSVPK